MAQESDHESNDDFERSLEAEVANSSKDEPTTKIVATELGNVLADQFTALAEHLQEGFSSLERTMTKAIQTKRKRKSSSSSSSSGSGSSDHSEQEKTPAKKPKQAKTSTTTDDLTEQVEDLLKTPEGNKSETSNTLNTMHDEVLNEISQELDCDELCSPPLLDKLATVVNKMLRTKLSEDKLKEKQTV